MNISDDRARREVNILTFECTVTTVPAAARHDNSDNGNSCILTQLFPPSLLNPDNIHTVNSVSPQNPRNTFFIPRAPFAKTLVSRYCEGGGIDRDGEQGTSVI